jgi:hypothetical protein
MWRIILRGGLLASMLLTAACTAAATPEPDRVATRVAEDLAVAQTLTAVAQQAVTPAEIAPTNTPVLPIDTIVPPVDTPAPIPIDTPTLPPPSDPTVPGFGNPNGLTGKILLPGYQGAQTVDTPVFHGDIVFRLLVFDPAAGNHDGDGITSVDFTISDPNGKAVHSRTENTAGYCAFGGGEPSCDVWRFAEHKNQWSDGTPVCAGAGYQAGMTVHTKDSNKDGAFWGFNFNIEGDYPSCQ